MSLQQPCLFNRMCERNDATVSTSKSRGTAAARDVEEKAHTGPSEPPPQTAHTVELPPKFDHHASLGPSLSLNRQKWAFLSLLELVSCRRHLQRCVRLFEHRCVPLFEKSRTNPIRSRLEMMQHKAKGLALISCLAMVALAEAWVTTPRSIGSIRNVLPALSERGLGRGHGLALAGPTLLRMTSDDENGGQRKRKVSMIEVRARRNACGPGCRIFVTSQPSLLHISLAMGADFGAMQEIHLSPLGSKYVCFDLSAESPCSHASSSSFSTTCCARGRYRRSLTTSRSSGDARPCSGVQPCS